MDLHDFRREYQQNGLRRKDLCDEPIAQFEKWFDELLTFDATDPTAMVLATTDAKQQVNQRIVLLKKVDSKGFVFFTNYTSAKGLDIQSNNCISLLFPWHQLERQVIIKGLATKLERKESDAYFFSRPIESQWAAWASKQSETLQSRRELMDRYQLIQQKYQNKVPAPEFWGGYRVEPRSIEFWQGGEQRLHDRFIYKLVNSDHADKNFDADVSEHQFDDAEETGQTWTIERLSP